MYRALLVLIAVGLVVAATGCTMCAHPYDYCGPTYMGGCGDCCDPDAVAGSILTGGAYSSDDEMVVSEEMPSGEYEGLEPTVLEPVQDEMTRLPSRTSGNPRRAKSYVR